LINKQTSSAFDDGDSRDILAGRRRGGEDRAHRRPQARHATAEVPRGLESVDAVCRL